MQRRVVHFDANALVVELHPSAPTVRFGPVANRIIQMGRRLGSGKRAASCVQRITRRSLSRRSIRVRKSPVSARISASSRATVSVNR